VLTPGATLVLGGARSGKSAFAERLVEESGLRPVYLATAQAFDGEMRDRISLHRERRGIVWRTVEEPLDLRRVLLAEASPGNAILVDCLTLWTTNLMMADSDLAKAFDELVVALPSFAGPVVFVSNEVGLGIVPDNAMARAFRDHAGRINQMVAAAAGQVYFIAAGIPMVLKAAANRIERKPT
jgi:adenosylcobinamide kinase/adenosylcobinamide-phosphate guanylyltransferase